MSNTDRRAQLIQQTAEDIAAGSEASRDMTAAKRILTKLRPEWSIPKLTQQLPDGKLNLKILNELIPELPMRFLALSTPWLFNIDLATLIRGDLPKTSLFRTYSDVLAREGIDPYSEYAGLITTWPEATTVVFHNWPHKDETVDRSSSFGRFVFVHNRKVEPIMYTLEPFDALLRIIERIGHDDSDSL